MSKRFAVVFVAAVGLVGSPAVQADAVPSAPSLWDGRIVAADGRPVVGEIVAYARPAGLGLDEGSAPLQEVARTRTDGSGRYVLRSLHTDVMRTAEDQNGWTNVMVAAFGDDGSFNLAFDSLAWAPAGGFHAQTADDPAEGRWITTPAERLAAERGEIRALSADAKEDPADVASERPPVMVLSNPGERGFSAQGSIPNPDKPADRNCLGVTKAEQVGDGIDTKVGEVHLDRDWTGNFSYSSTRSSSFQVGVRQGGPGWGVGGSTSSMQQSEFENHSAPELESRRLWNFAANLRYGHYWWRCYGAGGRWYDAESVQPYTWIGGLRPSVGGPEPGCNPSHTAAVQGNGGFAVRMAGRSTTYEGAVQVLGFAGSVTTTHGDKVKTTWVNKPSQTRLLCGERADPANPQKQTRIRSLP
jgi:hypothetical protein